MGEADLVREACLVWTCGGVGGGREGERADAADGGG
jgi:hypothetical protein